MGTVTWREVTRQNWQEALRLQVQPDQLRFVAEYAPVAAIALAKAYVRPGGLIWMPYVLYGDSAPLGFTTLAYEPGGREDFWIFHYFIDWQYQGHGYGSAGLARLIELVRSEHPQCEVVRLTVHPDNRVAQRLYTAAGFRPTGEDRWGERVYRLAVRATA